MAYCGQCGSRVYEGDKFCGSCGGVLLLEYQEPAATQEIPSQPRTLQSPRYTSSNSSTRLLVLAASAGLLLVLLGGIGTMALTGVNPIASVFAGTPPPEEASEDNPEEAVEEHYQRVGLEDWDYSYDNLDSSTQAMFTEEEWAKKNQYYWDLNPMTYHIQSVELDEQSLPESPEVDVWVRLTGEDGSSFVRHTAFILEDGSWKHTFLEEETQSFRPDLTYEEFLAAQ